MKNVKEKVKLSIDESERVAGGFSLGSFNLALRSQPRIAAYAQVAATNVNALKPVASATSLRLF